MQLQPKQELDKIKINNISQNKFEVNSVSTQSNNSIELDFDSKIAFDMNSVNEHHLNWVRYVLIWLYLRFLF